MCLIGIAWQAHREYPLIIAANRDELHKRPTRPAQWWPDAPEVFAGQDLQAGGTWLGIARSGRVSLVTNIAGRPGPEAPAKSRGDLVKDWLLGCRSVEHYLSKIAANQTHYAGFSLVIGSPAGLHQLTSPGLAGRDHAVLPVGVTAISNSPPEQIWPKAKFLAEQLTQMLADGDPSPEQLFALLANRGPVQQRGDPATTDLPAASRQPFIVHPTYGTRSSTVLLIDRHGTCNIAEHSFSAEGTLTGKVHIEFNLGD
jgi:uncharacterized protein with NRDE domain